MNEPADARNSPLRPVTYDDIKLRTQETCIKVWISGVKALVYAEQPYIGTEAIHILFLEDHALLPPGAQEEFYSEFRTKYFHISEPGHLIWGNQDENLWILEHRDE